MLISCHFLSQNSVDSGVWLWPADAAGGQSAETPEAGVWNSQWVSEGQNKRK